jgi:hypothetical protein
MISPSTVPVVEPVFRGIAPKRPTTLLPADAFERFGVPTPPEAYAQLRSAEVVRAA